MFIGREKELADLTSQYESASSYITLLYGKKGIGKTSLLKKFIRGKKSIYVSTFPSTAKEMEKVLEQRVFNVLDENDTIKVVVIENFENLSKNYEMMFYKIKKIIDSGRKILFLFTSSSIYWVENNMVEQLGNNVDMIDHDMKIKELTFVDVAGAFPNYSVEDCLKLYAISGGIPAIIDRVDENISLKENILNLFINDNAPFRNMGIDIVSAELRETASYNGILMCLAKGMNKLNELYDYLGFGRDKISVYLKNLMERDVVEKAYSFDTIGSKNTRKGIYRITIPVVEFWYRYIYPNASEFATMESSSYYNEFIKNDMKDMISNTVVKVANEYLDYLDEYNALPNKIVSKGRWYGKNSDISVIAKDEKGNHIVCQGFYSARQMSYEDYGELLKAMKQAYVDPMLIFLFSASGFDVRLTKVSKDDPSIRLVNLNEM